MFFLNAFIYLFMRDRQRERERERKRERERGRDTGRGRSRLHAGSLTWDSIQGPQITPWVAGGAKPLWHRGCPALVFLRFYLFIHERHTERGRDIGRGRSRLPWGA